MNVLRGSGFRNGGQFAETCSLKRTCRIIVTQLECFQKILKKSLTFLENFDQTTIFPTFSNFSERNLENIRILGCIWPKGYVDQTKLRQMFPSTLLRAGMPCKATVKQGGAYIKVVPVARFSSSAPGVVAQAFNKVARGIADGGEAVEAVVNRKTVSTCHA